MMKAVCLLDTSVFVEILNVPGMANQHHLIKQQLRVKVEDDERLFLPLATILETGNHIAQNGDGRQRRQCAERFITQVQQALDGKAPFTTISLTSLDQMREWLSRFPESAARGLGFGDLSIIRDYERSCEQNQGRKVYIWSLDSHLSAYCREPRR